MKTLRLLLASGTLAATGLTLHAQVPQDPPPAFTLASGFDYSRGSYGYPTDTEVTSFPIDLGYENGPWILRANLSHLTVKGPAAIVGAGAAPRPVTTSESGIGDIYVSGTYQAKPDEDNIALSSTVRVKLPTASEARGLGTGETDVYAQVDGYRTYGSVTPFGTVGYRMLGDNATYQLSDGFYASAGAHFRTSNTTVFTASYTWGQRLIASGDNTSDAMVAVTHDVNPKWRVMGYVLKGFTDASPDFGGGARLTYRF